MIFQVNRNAFRAKLSRMAIITFISALWREDLSEQEVSFKIVPVDTSVTSTERCTDAVPRKVPNHFPTVKFRKYKPPSNIRPLNRSLNFV